MEQVGQFLGHLYRKYVSMIGLKAPGNYSASMWCNKNLDLLMGEPKTPHFYDFGIFEPVTKPQNDFLCFETPGRLT